MRALMVRMIVVWILGLQTCCWPSKVMDDDALVAVHGVLTVTEGTGLAMPRSTREVPRRPSRSGIALRTGDGGGKWLEGSRQA